MRLLPARDCPQLATATWQASPAACQGKLRWTALCDISIPGSCTPTQNRTRRHAKDAPSSLCKLAAAGISVSEFEWNEPPPKPVVLVVCTSSVFLSQAPCKRGPQELATSIYHFRLQKGLYAILGPEPQLPSRRALAKPARRVASWAMRSRLVELRTPQDT